MTSSVKITRVAQTKRGRFSLYTEEGFLFSIHPEVFALSGVGTGSVLSIQQLEELRLQSEEKTAKEKALSLLGYSSRTKQQLYERLTRHADQAAAEAAVQRMEELGLVDDADYARRFCNDMLHLKSWAPRRIAQELKRRGVDADTIQDCFDRLEDYDPVEKITALVQAKYLGSLSDPKGRNRTIAALQRLGYDYSDIKTALRCIEEE